MIINNNMFTYLIKMYGMSDISTDLANANNDYNNMLSRYI